MFSVKLLLNTCQNLEIETAKSTANKFIALLGKKLNLTNHKIISSNHCVELVAGKEMHQDSEQIVVELLIRKHLVINKSDFSDAKKLDEYIEQVTNFCKQAMLIETANL